jgi:hypothetical protein
MDTRRLLPVSVGLALAATIASPPDVVADAASGAGVVTQLTGQATVARGTLPQLLALGLRDDVFLRDEIRTQERSVVHVLMGGKALLTVRELSVLRVTEDTGRVTVELQSGKIGLAVVRQRMKPGELIEIRTPNAVAAVRGTVLVTEIVPGPAGPGGAGNGLVTNVYLLHGALDVSLRSNLGTPPVSLQSLQTVAVAGNALRGVRALSSQEAVAITGDLKPQESARVALPGEFAAKLLTQESRRATEMARALASEGTHRHGSGVQSGSESKGNDSDQDKNGDKHAGKNQGDEHGKNKGQGKDNGQGLGQGKSDGAKDHAADLIFDAGDDGVKDQAKGNGSSAANGSTSVPTSRSVATEGANGSTGPTSTAGTASGSGGGTTGGGMGSVGGLAGGNGSSGGSVRSIQSGGNGPGGGPASGLAGLSNFIPPGQLKNGKAK